MKGKIVAGMLFAVLVGLSGLDCSRHEPTGPTMSDREAPRDVISRNSGRTLYQFNVDTQASRVEIRPIAEKSGDHALDKIVSSQIVPEAQNVEFDLGSNVFRFDLAIMNTSSDPIFTGLRIEITSLTSGPPTITVNNPDGGGSGVGAYWDYSGAVGGDAGLSGGEQTDWKMWEFYDPSRVNFRFYAEVIGPDLIINEIYADPASGSAGDANGDGARSATKDEFVELVNISGAVLDVSGYSIKDGLSTRHTFPTGTFIPSGGAVVIFGGGSPTGSFGGSLVYIASSGGLSLNNSGDTVTLFDASGAAIHAVAYGSEGGHDQSLTRDPDVTGTSFVKHSTATGSGGASYSPGTRADGSTF